MTEPREKHWLVRPRTIRLLWLVGGAILAIVTIGDVGVHGHAGFRIDGTFAFYSWFGLASCAAMVVGAKAMGAILKRREGHYDDE